MDRWEGERGSRVREGWSYGKQGGGCEATFNECFRL